MTNYTFSEKSKQVMDALKEMTQPCGANYAGSIWEYTPKDYRRMAHEAITILQSALEEMREATKQPVGMPYRINENALGEYCIQYGYGEKLCQVSYWMKSRSLLDDIMRRMLNKRQPERETVQPVEDPVLTVPTQAGIENIIRRHATGWIMDKEHPTADYLFAKDEDMTKAILAAYPTSAPERETSSLTDFQQKEIDEIVGGLIGMYKTDCNGSATVKAAADVIEMLRKRESIKEWQPPHAWHRYGMGIVRSRLLEDHVYLQGKNGDIWRVWLEMEGSPSIECVERNATLPKTETKKRDEGQQK